MLSKELYSAQLNAPRISSPKILAQNSGTLKYPEMDSNAILFSTSQKRYPHDVQTIIQK